MIFWTARLRYLGDDRLDITRGSGYGLGLLFAPSEQLLRGFRSIARAGRTGTEVMRKEFDRYAESYVAELRTRAIAHPRMWQDLLEKSELTVCCYCQSPVMCHRGVLARLLVARGATYEGERDV